MIEDTLALAVAMRAAIDTNLLLALVGEPRTPAEYADALDLDPRATGAVLDVLCACGIAVRDDKSIRASSELLAWVRSVPIDPEQMLALWAHTTEFLRTGRPLLRMDGADKPHYAHVVAGLGRMAATSARDLAAKLTVASPPARILDIGCGSGVWGLALAERFTDARVTGLDQPAVLDAFRARATELGLADRIDTLAGDVHEVSIPRRYDLVVIANVLRIETTERARRIVARAADALRSGGSLVVVDALAGGTAESERARAAYALHLAMRTERGSVHALDTVIGWMASAGVHQPECIPLEGPAAVGAVAGVRRGDPSS